MNYLAHLALSKQDGFSLIGSLLPDLSCGRPQDRWPMAVNASIERHHRIDRFTDNDPALKKLRKGLCSHAPRHSSILVDIVFDHFLAKHWNRWYSPDLNRFADSVYLKIEQCPFLIPDKAMPFFAILLEKRWLAAYREKKAVSYSLQSLASRIEAPNRFVECYGEFIEHYRELEEAFWEFFPRLMKNIQ